MQMAVSVYIDTFARGSRDEPISLRRASDATPARKGKRKEKERPETRRRDAACQLGASILRGMRASYFPAGERAGSLVLSFTAHNRTSKLAGRVDTSGK
jgi:hypothetical protein